MEEENIIEVKEEPGKEIKISKSFLIGIVAILLLTVPVFLIIKNQDSSEKGVAAIVNGEVITVAELNHAFETLPPQYAGTITKESLLNQMVQSKVIYQEAVKLGSVVSDEEADQQYQVVKLSSGLTDDQFSEIISSQSLTEDELKEQFSEQLTMQRFIEENLLNNIEISDKEILDYYSNNPDQFIVNEMVVVKHILIGDEGLTSIEKNDKALELLPRINKDNFCDYVSNYSTDTASVSACGEYSFSQKDAFVEEFKNLSFHQNIGEMGIAQTQFGAHIIWTVEKYPGKIVELGEISDQIEEMLIAKKGQEQFDNFYRDISKDSIIEIIYTEIKD